MVCERLCGAPTQTEHVVPRVKEYSDLVNKRGFFFFPSFQMFKGVFSFLLIH